MVTFAVPYAAKSTEDIHGSIPTQVEDCQAMAEREGWKVVDTFRDETFSAYSGNRGPGLERAKALAASIAAEHGRCILVAQDADRFARGAGDAPGAADHLGEVYFAMKRQGVELWTVRSGRLDLLRAAIEGERSHDESERKSQAVAAGHRRRWAAGKPLGGPIPDGYKLVQVTENGVPLVGKDGRAVRVSVLDPNRAPIIRRIFDKIEAGHTPGDVARALNADGVRKKRGGVWSRRDVRKIVKNPWYAGKVRGYGETIEVEHKPLIDPTGWERIVAGLERQDPVATRTRAGGRPTANSADDYLLRRIASCGLCGSSLYPRRLAAGRHYRCRAAREAQGTCDAPYIPAELVERAVIDHLDYFIVGVEEWIRDRAAKANEDRDEYAKMIERLRRGWQRLDHRAQKAHDLADRALDDGDDDDTAARALRKAESTEAERDAVAEEIASAEAKLADWPTTAEVDEALDFYTELRETISGRVKAAKGFDDLRAALRSILARVALKTSPDGSMVSAHFELVGPEVDGGNLPMIVSAGWRLDDPDNPLIQAIPAETVASWGRVTRREEPATTCS